MGYHTYIHGYIVNEGVSRNEPKPPKQYEHSLSVYDLTPYSVLLLLLPLQYLCVLLSILSITVYNRGFGLLHDNA